MTIKYKDLRNKSGLEFSDISTEISRQYQFPGDEFVTVNNPVALNVSDSGGHRLLDEDGLSHYIPSGWIRITWCAKPNAPHFVQ